MARKKAGNLLYAQSGGVTSVINVSAWGVIDAAQASGKVNRIYAGRNGILGVLNEQLVDVGLESKRELAKLRHTPGGAFGSCRLKLTDPAKDSRSFQRLADVFQAHDIKYFLYNGGNDSQDTTNKIAAFCRAQGVKVNCVGIPKTVDNDLAATDCCPGFGSVAKYVATTVAETVLDVASMSKTSTKLFILEVMGRHAGWITAAGGLPFPRSGPVILALPEITHNWDRFFKKVQDKIAKHGFCVVVASEGMVDGRGSFLSERGTKDSFAHAQLGGVAAVLAERTKAKLGVKYHWALADYMQRAARHQSSQVDVDQAERVGRAAVAYATSGKSQVMPAIIRSSDKPYRWSVKPVPLAAVANKERKLPPNYISSDGYYITAACRKYLLPLIAGEAEQPYRDGLPVHAQLKLRLARKKLKAFRT